MPALLATEEPRCPACGRERGSQSRGTCSVACGYPECLATAPAETQGARGGLGGGAGCEAGHEAGHVGSRPGASPVLPAPWPPSPHPLH